MVIYHNKGKRVITNWHFMVILYNNIIIQNHHKNHPKRGKGDLPTYHGNRERAILINAINSAIMEI